MGWDRTGSVLSMQLRLPAVRLPRDDRLFVWRWTNWLLPTASPSYSRKAQDSIAADAKWPSRRNLVGKLVQNCAIFGPIHIS
ncbi:unnamed protein product [Protopolystoma xenopodis]|uniref:Uncharacterized protein n=1 Tax=Protopolystoma xenopodis TaxID=117903 RepID=A0A448WZR7_9PLAT|nr:unnamed protein product [Protopolystoma xenopodis]